MKEIMYITFLSGASSSVFSLARHTAQDTPLPLFALAFLYHTFILLFLLESAKLFF